MTPLIGCIFAILMVCQRLVRPVSAAYQSAIIQNHCAYEVHVNSTVDKLNRNPEVVKLPPGANLTHTFDPTVDNLHRAITIRKAKLFFHKVFFWYDISQEKEAPGLYYALYLDDCLTDGHGTEKCAGLDGGLALRASDEKCRQRAHCTPEVPGNGCFTTPREALLSNLKHCANVNTDLTLTLCAGR